MANSRYEYVKDFELSDKLLPQCWVVLRIDGRAFTKFAVAHGFEKPNDADALRLMNDCALQCCQEFPDIVLAYGASDEYRFPIVRASSKVPSTQKRVPRLQQAPQGFVLGEQWPLQYPPSFDGRAVCYPSDTALRDYLSWRQADCHINNQYNTCFWSLVQKEGMSPADAQATLKGTVTKEKNELLFTRFGINYNALPEMFRKGSVVYKRQVESLTSPEGLKEVSESNTGRRRIRYHHVVEHIDIIGDRFWQQNPHILG